MLKGLTMTEAKSVTKYLAHFTSRANLEKILISNFLLPASETNCRSNSTDKNKICFFKDFDYNNKEIFNRFKNVFAKSKTIEDLGQSLHFDDVVCILVNEDEVDYIIHHNEKQELRNSFPSEMDDELYEKIGVYVKTNKPVPVNSANPFVL